MSNTETQAVHRRITARTPTVPDYRPLLDTKHGRMKMPARATIIVDVEGDPTLAHLELDVELVDRRYLVTRLEARPPTGGGVQTETLRSLPVALFLRAGVAHLVVMEQSDGETFTSSQPMHNADASWKVAMTYSLAHALGEPPTKAVMDDLKCSYNVAAQKVKEARKKGYLPVTEKGRAS